MRSLHAPKLHLQSRVAQIAGSRVNRTDGTCVNGARPLRSTTSSSELGQRRSWDTLGRHPPAPSPAARRSSFEAGYAAYPRLLVRISDHNGPDQTLHPSCRQITIPR